LRPQSKLAPRFSDNPAPISDTPFVARKFELLITSLIVKRSILCWLLLASFVCVANAEPTIFIVRHAEKADASKDPDLSEAGRARAEVLAKILRDAGITAIYSTEFKRTQETAAPLAKALGIVPTSLPAKDIATLAEKLRAEKGNTLVVAHGNTIPDLIKALGISDPINIPDNDYDEIFVVTLTDKPHLTRLHYP
jgi:broad specificity phosphatase PhoE